MLSPSLKLRHERPKAAPLLRSTSAEGENADRKPSGGYRTSAPAVVTRAVIWAARTPLCAARPSRTAFVIVPQLATRPAATAAANAIPAADRAAPPRARAPHRAG